MVRLHFTALKQDPEFNRFLDEFQGESDRAAAVLGAAYLDDLLKDLILKSWVDGSATGKDLLKKNQPLGSFGPRISIAYAMGLITKTERQDLDRIRDTRNDFAHLGHGLSFTNTDIANRCSTFELVQERLSAEPNLKGEYDRANPRARFNLAVALLAYYLTRRLANAHRFPPPEPPLWPRYDIGGERRSDGGAA